MTDLVIVFVRVTSWRCDADSYARRVCFCLTASEAERIIPQLRQLHHTLSDSDGDADRRRPAWRVSSTSTSVSLDAVANSTTDFVRGLNAGAPTLCRDGSVRAW